MILEFKMFWLSPICFLALIRFSHSSSEHGIYGFDDNVMFKINWPGADTQSNVNQNDNASSEGNILGREIMYVKTANNEKYECHLPTVTSQEPHRVEEYNGPTPLELLSPLFSQKVCSFRLESYWSYELCHGRYLRQYHEEREGKKVKIQEYYLGKWSDEKQQELAASMSTAEARGEKLKHKNIEGLSLPYVEIDMEDGTMCDLNGRPRMAKVLYVCYMHGKHEVYTFKEISTCEYEIVILSPFLCAHPKYRPKASDENDITCKPVGDSPKKPRSMMKMEAESLKARHLSTTVNNAKKELAKDMLAVLRIEKIGEDGETQVKYEIHSLGGEGGGEVGGEGGGVAPSPPTTEPARRTEFDHNNIARPRLHDDSPVRAFLDGQNCLSGGTGWWKYEFCYGKSVEQYHVNANGQRESIWLGRFDKEQHIKWLNENPHKRPKAKGQRTSISHFYAGGTICDKTGKPRQTEVKLKCLENSSTTGQVSIYLLEPKTCQYILGVSSPLICDILNLADDDALVTMPKMNSALNTESVLKLKLVQQTVEVEDEEKDDADETSEDELDENLQEKLHKMSQEELKDRFYNG